MNESSKDPNTDHPLDPADTRLIQAIPIKLQPVPEEDNDDEMVGTIFTRREAISVVGKAGLGLAFVGGLGAAAQNPKPAKIPALVATPGVTEGPFFVDERLKRANVVTSAGGRDSVLKAHPLTLKFIVSRISAKYGVIPFEGLYVDIWCADAIGAYSDEQQGLNPAQTTGLSFLRGYQITDSKGEVTFQTIWPGWYNGRTPHIHFKIRAFDAQGNATSTFTSQVFFDDKLSDKVFLKPPYTPRNSDGIHNVTDNIYNARQADGTMVGSHLMLDLKHGENASSASFHVGLVTNT